MDSYGHWGVGHCQDSTPVWPKGWSTSDACLQLPPYVFSVTAELKVAARRGEDIIDMSMGNPDGPTPPHTVEKLIDVTKREDTHGYSTSNDHMKFCRKSPPPVFRSEA